MSTPKHTVLLVAATLLVLLPMLACSNPPERTAKPTTNPTIAAIWGTDTPEPTETLTPTDTPEPTKTTSPTRTPTALPEGMLSEVGAFLESHKSYGRLHFVGEVSDWAKGKKQNILLYNDSSSNYREMVFYIKDGEVTTVWEFTKDEGQVLIWGLPGH